MKRVLAAATVGLVALAMAISSQAAPATPATPQVQALERRLAFTEDRMHRLEQRRAYLHRYIRHLRARFQHPTPSSSSTGGSTTTTSSSVGASSSGGWANELAAAGFPASAIPHMLYIIDRESGGCPTAVNGLSGCPSYSSAASFLAASESHACGLIQAYPCFGGAAWFDPMTNLRVGFQKYQASGFGPWGG